MAKNLQQLIGYDYQTTIIQSPEGGVPADLVPPAFLSPNQPPAEGNVFQWSILPDSRKNAGTDNYGSASRRLEQSEQHRRTATLLHTFKHQYHSAATLMRLRNESNPQVQQRGQQEIDRQTGVFRQRLNNNRVSSLYSALSFGAIYLDANGDILPSSSGAVRTVDLGVPAGHKSQLDIDGSGNVIAASWATDTTDIIGQVKAVRRKIRQKTGKAIRHAFYGADVPEMLISNNSVKELLKANAAMSEAFRTGDIPSPFCKIEWHPVDEAFFETVGGTIGEWFASDKVVFTPDPDPSWYGLVEGSYAVPTSVGGVSADAGAANGDLATVYGMFSYATVSEDPVGIKHYMGDTWLPFFTDAEAIAIADVVP